MMRLARKRGLSKVAAQVWVYSELDRMYPPPDVPAQEATMSPPQPKTTMSPDSGQIQGLSDLPGSWPQLPANASLNSEIGWVQANRLRVVRESPGSATLV